MRRIRLLAVSLAAVAAVGAPTACSTQSRHIKPARALPSSPLPASEQDRTWLKTAHQGNLAEVEAGEIAQHNGTTAEIRSIGAMLVQDHRALDARLTAVAGRLGVEVPNAPSAEQAHTADELRKGSGRTFDIHWLSEMTRAHEKAVAETGTEISKGSAPEVRNLARNALPVLERHLTRIKVAEGS